MNRSQWLADLFAAMAWIEEPPVRAKLLKVELVDVKDVREADFVVHWECRRGALVVAMSWHESVVDMYYLDESRPERNIGQPTLAPVRSNGDQGILLYMSEREAFTHLAASLRAHSLDTLLGDEEAIRRAFEIQAATPEPWD